MTYHVRRCLQPSRDCKCHALTGTVGRGTGSELLVRLLWTDCSDESRKISLRVAGTRPCPLTRLFVAGEIATVGDSPRDGRGTRVHLQKSSSDHPAVPEKVQECRHNCDTRLSIPSTIAECHCRADHSSSMLGMYHLARTLAPRSEQRFSCSSTPVHYSAPRTGTRHFSSRQQCPQRRPHPRAAVHPPLSGDSSCLDRPDVAQLDPLAANARVSLLESNRRIWQGKAPSSCPTQAKPSSSPAAVRA
jgi:hypothetical protein